MALNLVLTWLTNERGPHGVYSHDELKSWINKGSAPTVRPRFSKKFQDCKIAVWKDTQDLTLQQKFNYTTLEIAFNFEHFFQYN